MANSVDARGTNSHENEDGTVIYMPFATHEEYNEAVEAAMEADNDGGFVEEMRDKIRNRLTQLVDSSTTENGL